MCFERLLLHSLDHSKTSYSTQVSGPSLNTIELVNIQPFLQKNTELQLSIRFTPSRCSTGLVVQVLSLGTSLVPNVGTNYLHGMKAWISPVQSIEPRRILAPTGTWTWTIWVHSPELLPLFYHCTGHTAHKHLTLNNADFLDDCWIFNMLNHFPHFGYLFNDNSD